MSEYTRPGTYPSEWTREALGLLLWLLGVIVSGNVLYWYLVCSAGGFPVSGAG